MAGIFGGLQSLHTDSYDEALSCPTDAGARIAVATQNILREEAHLTDVIDPLGGSFYIERLTDQMQAEILRIIQLVADAGGMYKAVEAGLVQKMIGESARRFQASVESGAQTIVGVNAYQVEEDRSARRPLERLTRAHARASSRSRRSRRRARAASARHSCAGAAAQDPRENVFGKVVEAAEAGCTHGEICGRLRKELGFGHVQAVV
jgi:methylmalonyl-CoA mutase N-terminal domain/subunit